MTELLLRRGKQLISRGLCSLNRKPLHVCIVGSGPAGFYTAEKMLKAHETAEVDLLDRLPTPFGLVRSGVAPDHPETKIVVNQFSRVASNERCSFFGNISLGSDISLPELRDIYDVVVVAYGAESDRSLGVLGEDLSGIYSAREFVWWYNGHPDSRNLTPHLKNTDTAVVLGQGNVALDVSRILLRPVNELRTTDISEHALISLQESTIRFFLAKLTIQFVMLLILLINLNTIFYTCPYCQRKVYVVGRRGPAQAAFTAKELREILGMKDVLVHINKADLVISPTDEEELKNSRIQRRVYDLLCKSATSYQRNDTTPLRELHFIFFRKPDRFLPSEDQLNIGAVRLEKTRLIGMPGKQTATGTGQFEDLNCGLVLKSIGYKSLPVDGLPFDKNKGVVPNEKGRVLSSNQIEQANMEQGLYVVGWLKRGPTGIIATNLYCAEETVASILEDLNNNVLVRSSKPGRQGLLQLLKNKNVRFVPFSGWEKIDSKEKFEGQLRNKPREKLTTWNELLRVADG